MSGVHPVRGAGRGIVRLAALALQFLTRVPLRLAGDVAPRELAASMAFYPAVGLFVGAGTAALGYAAAAWLPLPAAAVVAVAAGVIVTGNLHLDGLTDTADGVFGAYEPARRLEIMKDSRIGAHGVAAGVLALGLKVTLLAGLEPADWWRALPLALVAGRWALVYGAYRHPYARAEGLGRVYSEHVRPVHLLAASVSALLFAAALSPAPRHLSAALAAALLTAWALGAYLRRKVGGMTGDTLGALNEAVEIAVLVAFTVAGATTSAEGV